MTTPRLRRSGVTLLEVLVAIFIMGIGLLALLTLFPLGAIQMAQALKDDRTGGEASHSDALLRNHWRNAYLLPPTNVNYRPMAFQVPGPFSSSADAFADPQAGMLVGYPQLIYPNYPTPATVTPPGQPPAFLPGSPSYPVMLDGLGYFARGATNTERSWVGRRSVSPAVGPPSSFLIPRRSALGFTSSTPTGPLIEAFSLTDDLTFEKNGMAVGPTVERQGRYNWAAIVQQPRYETSSVAKLSIMVFDGRSALLASDGDEMVVSAPLTIGERTVTLTVPPRNEGSAPLIRRGGWIMDSTINIIDIAQPVNNPATDRMWIRNANFYRISGLTELSSGPAGTTFLLDLDTPIKPLWDGRTLFRVSNAPLSYTANITLFAGLSEVFERSQLRPGRAHELTASRILTRPLTRLGSLNP